MSMLPLVPFRQPPLGYTEDRDASVWNVGFVYRWSDVYDAWMESGRCTVKPDQTCREAFEDSLVDLPAQRIFRWGSIIPYFSMRQCKEGFNDYNGFTEKTDGIG